jgi:exopolysaccharide biosynthesis polyprenyl glycosylphosphotransferase
MVPISEGIPPLNSYIISAFVIAPFWLWLFKSRGLYRIRRDVDMSLEFFQIIRIVFLGMLLVMSAAFFYREFSYSRVIVALIGVLVTVFLMLGRIFVYSIERFLYAHGKELKNIAIVGVNSFAESLAFRIAHHPDTGYSLTGYFSDDEEIIESAGAVRLGDISSIAAIVERDRIEALFICRHMDNRDSVDDILNQLTGKSVQILLQPETLGIVSSRITVEELFAVPFIAVKDVPMTSWNRIVKRLFDLLFSAAVIVVSSPVCALLALLTLIDSGRPVFYSQKRVGLDGQEFDLYKFRTMRVDAERDTGPTWTKKNDPRVTTLGRILRRLSLDEIPQFFNVLKGDMSIVGPRPERPMFVDQFKQYIPKYLERHRMKVGLTGWAQVNGLRGEAPISERTKFDIYYIEHWSMKFDVRIIFKTIRAIIFGKDAY